MAKNNLSMPKMERAVTLHTLQAQKVYNRGFVRGVAALYRADVLIRIIGSEEQAEQTDMLIESMLSKLDAELKRSHEAFSEKLDALGITDVPAYTAPAEHTVDITSPNVGRYLSLIELFDHCMRRMDALWLNGVYSNKEHNDFGYKLQNQLSGVGMRIVGIERKARESVRREGKEDEASRELGEEVSGD
jgi:hypothetical protein